MIQFTFQRSDVPTSGNPYWTQERVHMRQRALEIFQHSADRFDLLANLDQGPQDCVDDQVGVVRTASGAWARFDPETGVLEAAELMETPLVGSRVKLSLDVDEQGPVLVELRPGCTRESVRWTPEGTLIYTFEERPVPRPGDSVWPEPGSYRHDSPVKLPPHLRV
jgi:hypothetical protein